MSKERTLTRDGFTVDIFHHDDTNPDLSYLGEFWTKHDTTPQRPYFDRALDMIVREYMEELTEEQAAAVERWNPREWRYITGGCGDPDYMEQDARRLLAYGDTWSCIGIEARVSYKGVELARASVWGFENDSETCDREQVEDEVTAEALTAAKLKLAELREATS